MKVMFRVGASIVCAVAGSIAGAQTLDPVFAPFYTIVDQGSVPGVPGSYGGLTVANNDTNVLLIGGAANSFDANIYSVRFTRQDGGSMVGFDCGDAVVHADANGTGGGIDGGLTYGPDGVLFYSTYSDNTIGQILPGSSGPDSITTLTSLGVASSTGTLAFVPDGFPGAGRLKIASFNASTWYDTTVSPAGDGTFTINPVGPAISIGGGPEGIVYIAAGNPGFAVDSVLVCEWSLGRVVAYDIDANGDPIVATRRIFITGLSGAEGATIDPLTGDFLFSTFGGGDRVIRVVGFTGITPPGDMNCDGIVTVSDIGGFVLALTNPGGYAKQFPDCDLNNADVNDDGVVTVSDIGPFVELLTGGTGC